MDIDPKDLIEQAQSATELKEARSVRLNAAVAVTVAVLATFMGICKVKDDNIVQAMQQAQADKLDHWAYYQARNLRQEVAEAALTQMELARPAPGEAASSVKSDAYAQAIDKYRTLAKEQAQKKEEMKAAAEQDQLHYDASNYRDDQFDLSDALLAIAIAMLAVTALTGMWALYWAALVPTGFGVLMGVAGLAALPIHPDALIKLLS
ncbi:MAG: DUF4337 domain-containing protein [Aquabacterium sp.]|nr:MAG: DUF4337 domain-containing protein [Aquabacterium sp.]